MLVQARSETLEALLLLTTAELKQVQSKQAPLEQRIQLLETLVTASKVSSSAALPAISTQVSCTTLTSHDCPQHKRVNF